MTDVLTLIRDAIDAMPEATGPERELKTAASGAATRIPLLLGTPVHIPDGRGGCYKTEIVVFDGPQGTIKINYWHAADPRPEPHDHPWCDDLGIAFRSHVLSGGYTETRHRPDGRGGYAVEELKHKAGDVVLVRHDNYHTVDSVQPNTVTLMICGPRVEDPWGYLVKGEHTEIKDPAFFPAFVEINPHRRAS